MVRRGGEGRKEGTVIDDVNETWRTAIDGMLLKIWDGLLTSIRH